MSEIPITAAEEAARRLEMMLLSKDKDSVLLGLQLAQNPSLQAGQLTILVALHLFHYDGVVRDQAHLAVKVFATPSLLNHINDHWQETHRKGRAKVFYEAVRELGKHEEIDKNRFLKMAVRLTMKFPEGVGHQFPAAFAEWCHQRTFNGNSLHLNGYYIPHLPSSIGQFEHLKYLSLEGCQLKKLHPALGKLTQLESLIISSNELEELPDYLDRLKGLLDLRWDGNPIRQFPLVISRMDALRKLDLNLKTMKDLTGLDKCRQVGWLQLKKASQETIPKEVMALTQLKSLEMSEAGLQSVPEGLARFWSLEELDLSGNDFAHFPEVILRVPRLRSLALGRIDSPEPTRLYPLWHLQRLTMSCGFAEWPTGWCDLPQLMTLYLENGELERLPEEFTRLKQLGSLNLENNQLTEFPEVLLKMPNLMKLELHNNQLTEIPDEISKMTSLAVLDLSHNPLTDLPEGIFKLTRLSYLFLGNTKLTRIMQNRLRKELPKTEIKFQ